MVDTIFIENGVTSKTTFETVEFEHPMGKLVLSSAPDNEYYCIISFVPNEVIDPTKVEAIRWFFEDGDGRFTGWETTIKED